MNDILSSMTKESEINWGQQMELREWYQKMSRPLEKTIEYRLEGVILDITEKIYLRMKQKKINRAELAELLNVSPAVITKVLRGNSNFTLKTLLSLSDALDMELLIDFKDKKEVDSSGEVLDACPFCGQDEYLSPCTGNQIECAYCGAKGPRAITNKHAVKKWNNRGPHPAL